MIDHPLGVVVAVGAILIFHGSVYALVALNMGWRFGYWVTGASFFGLMFVMSLFWLVTALGPRGHEPTWVPAGVDTQTVSQVTVEEQTLTSPARYPRGDWQAAPEEGDQFYEENDPVRSSIGNCLDATEEALEAMPEGEREVCEEAQSLLPQQLPRTEGLEIIATNEVTDIRFAEEEGVVLAVARITPITRDPRVVENPEQPAPVGEPFVIAAYRDPGNLRLPALKYVIGSTLLLLLHLWGLSRAERKVLSPVVAL